MKTHILTSDQLTAKFQVFAHPNMASKDMNYFRQDMRSWFHNPKHVYFVISEHMEFRYPDGEYEDGTQAYSDFCGDFPIAVLKLYAEDDGFFTLSYIQVANQYQGKKLSKTLIQMMVEWLLQKKINLIQRTFPSSIGEQRCFNNITTILKENGIAYGYERYRFYDPEPEFPLLRDVMKQMLTTGCDVCLT
jgi:GNAT superfamily N-acetyltransferase